MKWLVLLVGLLLIGCCATKPKEHPSAPSLSQILTELPDTSDENPGYQAPIVPDTEATKILENEHGWQLEGTKVPAVPGMTPVMCFQVKNARMLECLYKDLDDEDVEMRWVVPVKEKL